jgi:2-methylcitrate dehydratase PrpD
MNQISKIGPDGAGLTRALAEQALSVRYETLSDEARALARQCILDYLACTLPGAAEPLTAMMLAEMEEQGGKETATIVGHSTRLPALSAALVNGSASHALDFDDVNLAMPGHPSVAILPALLALAEERGSSGKEVIAAFVAGYELQCRVGTTISPGHYDGLGFHSTATVGSFGAAAACAHLLGLNAEQTATALGIAGTQAAGLKSMFGTMCKPLHAGKAAYHGLLAAKLAARGFTSRDDVLECNQGFSRTHSPDFNPGRALETPPGDLYLRANLFKYHAACYLTHAPIETARKLRDQHGVTPDSVRKIVLRVDQVTDRVCNIPKPTTGLEAKFSLRLTTAMALNGIDTGRLDTYTDENTADPVLVGLRDKIEIDFQQGWPNTLAELDIHLADGRVVTARHDAGIPAPDVAEQGRRLEEKCGTLAEPVIGANRVRSLIGAVAELDNAPNVRELMALCV